MYQIKQRMSDKAKGTSQVYRWYVKKYLDWIEEKRLDILNNPDQLIEDFLKDKEWSASTVNCFFWAINMYYKRIHKTSLNFDYFVNIGHKSKWTPRVLTDNELEKIFNHTKKQEPQRRAMIYLGWDACLRSLELCSVMCENLTEEKGKYVLRVQVLKTKGRKYKTIGIPEETYKLCMRFYTKPENYLFRRDEILKENGREKVITNRHLRSEEWSKWFRGFTAEALGEKDGIRWHDFARHTRLTKLVEQGATLEQVIQLSGHMNMNVCRQYFVAAKVEPPAILIEQKWGR